MHDSRPPYLTMLVQEKLNHKRAVVLRVHGVQLSILRQNGKGACTRCQGAPTLGAGAPWLLLEWEQWLSHHTTMNQLLCLMETIWKFALTREAT
jgi:hypothetical protein